MTVWISFSWKILIQVSKKWLEMVVKSQFSCRKFWQSVSIWGNMVYPIHLLKFESPFLRILSIYSIMICWSWNSFQSQCYLLYFCFDFIVPSNSHLMIPIKMQWRQTLQSFWTGHWNKKPKSEHQICTCRLDWESHKISRTDFPLRQDCLSICYAMPKRF